MAAFLRLTDLDVTRIAVSPARIVSCDGVAEPLLQFAAEFRCFFALADTQPVRAALRLTPADAAALTAFEVAVCARVGASHRPRLPHLAGDIAPKLVGWTADAHVTGQPKPTRLYVRAAGAPSTVATGATLDQLPPGPVVAAATPTITVTRAKDGGLDVRFEWTLAWLAMTQAKPALRPVPGIAPSDVRDAMCAITWDEAERGDDVGVCSACGGLCGAPALKRWLALHATCPRCRAPADFVVGPLV